MQLLLPFFLLYVLLPSQVQFLPPSALLSLLLPLLLSQLLPVLSPLQVSALLLAVLPEQMPVQVSVQLLPPFPLSALPFSLRVQPLVSQRLFFQQRVALPQVVLLQVLLSFPALFLLYLFSDR